MKSFSKVFGITFTVAVFAASALVIFNSQAVIDWWRLRDYQPPVVISELATSASFNEEGRRLFYVHYPEVLDKTNFSGKCTNTEETIVLGCYISHDKIYVYDVTDERLEGVEQVTAAHEMLHAVYDRLSNSEKEELDAELLKYYAQVNDERLNSTIENYKKRDPSVVPNELHSILGTEFRDLPKTLADHYNKYFIKRLDVVTLSENYEAEFTRREDLIKTYDSQLRGQIESINQQESQIELLGSALSNEQKQLEALRGDTDSYNAAVVVFNQKVRSYNNLLEKLKTYIVAYNQLVKTRNEVAIEEQELVKAIDSRTLPEEL